MGARGLHRGSCLFPVASYQVPGCSPGPIDIRPAPTPRAIGHPGGMGADSPGSCEARTRGKARCHGIRTPAGCEGCGCFNPSRVVAFFNVNPGCASRPRIGYPLESLRDKETAYEERLRRVQGQHRYRPQLGLDSEQDPTGHMPDRVDEDAQGVRSSTLAARVGIGSWNAWLQPPLSRLKRPTATSTLDPSDRARSSERL